MLEQSLTGGRAAGQIASGVEFNASSRSSCAGCASLSCVVTLDASYR